MTELLADLRPVQRPRAARIAIAHDYLVQYGGAERVVEALHEAFPEAPVYTTMYEPDALPPVFREMDVHTSFLQDMPGLRRHFKLGLPLYQTLAAPLLPALRRWDRRSARRPTEYLANSAAVRERIFTQYRRAARVVHPPVETSRFRILEPEDFYLCASRLQPYKRIDLAIEACKLLGARLVIA